MSEFKYACPVCGQHMKCDTTQSGTIMECPTCLQKIIAPQAPTSADQKFIITGKKLEDRPKVPVTALGTPAAVAPKRKFPTAGAALLVLLVISATAAIVFHDMLFKSGGTPPTPMTAENPKTGPQTNKPPKPPALPVVIPHASDTNWGLNLTGVEMPETPAAGRIHGQDFLAERAFLQNGTLTLRQGSKGSVDFGMVINFSGVQAESLAGQTINITTNAPLAARVTLRWKETDQSLKDNFETGYALHLVFGELAKNHLRGKIYFCAPDEDKSYVAGTFNAEIRKPKPPAKPKPQAPQS
jgi:hypothetical protein